MHDAAYYIQLLLSGVTVGSLYALVAIGYTMVYGILRLINFAHGDIFMMAGFFMIYLSATMPMAVSIPLVLILTVLLGVAIEKAAYSPLRTAPRMSVMISAIGVSYLLQNLATYITGGIARAYPDIPFLTQVMQMGSLSVKRITIITPILTIALVVVLVILIQKTKIGMAMRAVSRDFETAQLMGIKINSVISMTFVIGSLLAGVASILYFSNYGQVSPMIGAMPGLKAFVAAVFGGIGSIPGAVIGAFIIGICESFIKANETIAVFSNAFTFALLIVILLCKPNGLFGEKLTEIASPPQAYLVVAKPDINVSTPVVYRALDSLPSYPHPDVEGMIQALEQKDLNALCEKLGNVLELVTAKEYPVIGQIEDVLLKEGAKAALMSGSGPSVFGIFDTEGQAQTACKALEKAALAKQLFVTTFENGEG